ncbi:polymerase [Synergistales bacterium]|nr:polymerase [Synergistales bacterium]
MADDTLKIEADSGGIYLTLVSDEISLPAVMRFLERQGVRKYNAKAVEELVRQKIRTRQKIAERNVVDERDAVIGVQIAKDGLSATVTLEPPFFTKPWPSAQDIEDTLTQKGVTFGIDKEAIANLLSLRATGDAILVAKGEAPKNGANARIELILDPDKVNEQEAEQTTEKIDYRTRSVFLNVRTGDKIAVKHQATEGQDGTSVLGVLLKAVPGKDIGFSVGSGLEVSEDGLTLSALLDGRLLNRDKKLMVLPELEVNGDVDFGVGNINFTGSVKIKGAVRDGFSVVATGDIEISEVVEGAHIETASNVTIGGGVRGMGKGKILADGTIKMGFADQAYLRSRGDIEVKNAILHSEVVAQNNVTVMGGSKGQIAGGKVQAGMEVICQTLGSEMGTRTEVIVGLPPEQVERRKELQTVLAQNKEENEKIEANLVFLKKLEQAGKLDDEKRQIMVKLMQSKFKLQASLKSTQEELQELEERLELGKAKGVVRVKGVCYPGVNITIRGVSYAVQSPFKFASFSYVDGEVKMKSYDA